MPQRILADRYRIERKLGEGGMAEVYLAHDLLLDREVALKLLKPGEQGREYFAHEFRVLARLDHPNLIRVHDFGAVPDAEEGEPACYYTCEYLTGEDLFRATRGMDWDDLYEVVRQVLEALAYIHDRGLVHYDVKPENVNVAVVPPSRPGARATYRVKLVDFGLTGEATTRRGEKIKGTVHYVAPEVAKSLPADHRADLYSLGVSLYYVVTGKLPYDGGSAFSIIRKHLERPPAPPGRLRADLPEAWAACILRLLEKEPGRRHATAHETLADLSRRLGKPFQGRGPGGGGVALNPTFAGRQRERERLEGLLPGKDRPAPPRTALLIEGEEGIGKSRLVHELKVAAQLRGVAFVAVSCRDERPWEQALRLLLVLEGARELTAAFRPELERLLPGALPGGRPAAPAPDEGVAADPDRDELRRGLDRAAELLLHLAARTPYALALEDLQAADELTVALLGAVLRTLSQAEGAGPLLLLTCRPGPHRGDLAALLGPLREASCLPLGALAPEGTAAMVASMLALPEPGLADDPHAELAGKVHEATGGNPLFVEELVRSLLAEGVVALRQGVAPGALGRVQPPRSLSELLGHRLARLPGDAHAVLLALAVLEAPSPLRLLAATAALEPGRALDALDELRRGHLAEPAAGDGPPRYRLTHGQVQRAVQKAAVRPELVAAHARALEALEAEHPPEAREAVSERLAHHASACGDLERALRYAQAAGLRALREGEAQQAIAHLDRALELLRWETGVGPAGEARARQETAVLTRLSEALATVGRYRDAARALEELLALGDAVLGQAAAVWVRRRLGDLALRRGGAAEARRWLKDALTAAGDARALRAERARVLEVMSRMALWQGDYLQVIALTSEAAELWRGLGRGQDSLWALNILCAAEYYRGRTDRAAEVLRASLGLEVGRVRCWEALLDRMGFDPEARAAFAAAVPGFAAGERVERPAGDAWGLLLFSSELGTWFDLQAAPELAVRFHEASLRTQERRGDAQRLALTRNNLGVYLRHQGRLGAALAHLDASLAVSDGTQDRHGAAVALVNLALLRLLVGDAEGALERGRRALASARELGLTWLTGHCHRLIGRALAAQDQRAEADRELQRAVGVFRMIGNARSLADLALDRAELAWAGDDGERAQALAARARVPADPAPGPDLLARLRLLEGELRLVREPARAVDDLAAALEQARRAGVAELALDAHRALAQAYARLGLRRPAREHQARAEDLTRTLAIDLPPELQASWERTPAAVRARQTARIIEEQELAGS